MSSTYGNKLKIAIFGESHGKGVGVVIDGFPAGFRVDLEYINNFLERRKSTLRKENDIPEILSGVKDDFTTGAPICAFIKNNDADPKDYPDKLINPRPSHADYNAYVKYDGCADHRGGGHFSGRLTAPLVFAGALCAGWLDEKYNIKINAKIKHAGDITPGDSIGAIVGCVAENVPQGLGEHIFNSVEAAIASCVFGIPGIKGIEFGLGFGFASMRGSEANDEFYYDNNGAVRTKTNNNGGIIGGISTGAPIIFSVAFKPTPSIFSEQDTVNLETKTNDRIKIKGRHDPCIAVRALPAVEAAAAVAIMGLAL
jgi:chorismate synthase